MFLKDKFGNATKNVLVSFPKRYFNVCPFVFDITTKEVRTYLKVPIHIILLRICTVDNIFEKLYFFISK
jgi:hypothetical protein